MLSTLFSLALLAARPDVVLVTIDTLRADRVGAYGSLRGPAIDAWRVGVVVPTQWSCADDPPSHASLMTGLLLYQHGIVTTRRRPRLHHSDARFAWAALRHCRLHRRLSRLRGSGLENGFETYDDPFVPRRMPQPPRSIGTNARRASHRRAAWLETRHRPRFIWVHPRAALPLRALAAVRREVPGSALRRRRRPIASRASTATLPALRLVVVTSDHGGPWRHGRTSTISSSTTHSARPLILAGPTCRGAGRCASAPALTSCRLFSTSPALRSRGHGPLRGQPAGRQRHSRQRVVCGVPVRLDSLRVCPGARPSRRGLQVHRHAAPRVVPCGL
jgi:hypothetical protein